MHIGSERNGLNEILCWMGRMLWEVSPGKKEEDRNRVHNVRLASVYTWVTAHDANDQYFTLAMRRIKNCRTYGN